jgi:2-alkenal reductase
METMVMKLKLGIILTCLILILTLAGCALPEITSKTPSVAPSQAPITRSFQSSALSDSPLAIESLLESIYAQVNPSVVNIQVIEQPTTTIPSFPGLNINPGQQQSSSALASGFVWDTEGNIVTNNHVVSGSKSISVTFEDGTTIPATVVGTDPDSDLAVIKVDVSASQLHPVQLADSSSLKVGQLAVAIGNPFGLQGTMTVGFISALGRLLPSDQNATGATYNIPDIIQTDASINPGNSGGVLLNDAGQVIGVTAAIATDSGSSSGVGFAIPSTIVQQVVPNLIKNGHYDHPWLGVSVTSLTPDIVDSMKLQSGQRGALVEQVIANSPADKAGLQASQRQVTINGQPVEVGGDVIIAFGSQIVRSSDDLVTYLSEYGSIGQTVSLTVIRDGKQIQVSVTLAARPFSS